MRLLKKLRTIRRKHPLAISIRCGWSQEPSARGLVAPFSANGLWSPSSFAISFKHQTGRFATSLGLALVFTSLANAQQFQTPRLPNEPTESISLELQARLQHAEALKAQMRRAQFEQGAPSEFAIKAYEAQQAYQAERAFDEYMVYLEKQKQLQQAQPDQFSTHQADPNWVAADSSTGIAPAQYQAPSNPPPRLVDSQPQSPVVAARSMNQQSTFVPPVHIAPSNRPEPINFSDESKAVPSSASQIRDQRQFAVQDPAPGPVQPRFVDQSQQALVNLAPPAIQRPRRQLATTQRIISPQHSILRQTAASQAPASNLPQPQTAYQPRGYILQENGFEGLQDRISNLLSKPRYRQTNLDQPQLAPSVSAPPTAVRRVAEATPSTQQRVSPNQAQSSPRRSNQSQRSVSHPVHMQFSAPANQASRATPIQSNRIPTPAVQPRRDANVQYAFEMQQRRDREFQNRRAVQQVMMVEPAQDPFNDLSVDFSPASDLRLEAPEAFDHQSRPDRQAFAVPLVDENTPSRQISVLSNRGQDGRPSQDNQFGPPLESEASQIPNQEFQPPSANNVPQAQEPFGLPSAEDLKKYDEELNRRFQELESKPGDETTRVDDMVKELEKELEQDRNEQRSSVLDDSTENQLSPNMGGDIPGTVSTLKTCDEFRNELLNASIRDISMDMSPLASRNRSQNDALSRNWTDRAGNVVATGKMIDLRRGYVIIDGAEGQQRIAYAKLSDADWATISEYWRIPELCSVGNQGDAARSWIPQTFTWKASSLCHKPLFFENIQLERYGHTHGPIAQPIRSVAHFFVSFITVPYQSGIHPATECQYALGFYRPGDCAPWLKDPIPFSLNGTARQAIITTGAAFIP